MTGGLSAIACPCCGVGEQRRDHTLDVVRTSEDDRSVTPAPSAELASGNDPRHRWLGGEGPSGCRSCKQSDPHDAWSALTKGVGPVRLADLPRCCLVVSIAQYPER